MFEGKTGMEKPNIHVILKKITLAIAKLLSKREKGLSVKSKEHFTPHILPGRCKISS